MKPQQKDLLTKRWRNVVALPVKEVSFHISLVSLLRFALRPDVLFWHTPNGGLRENKREAAKLKAMGVLPGVADLQFHWLDHFKRRRVLHLELKARRGELGDRQKEFELAVRLLGDDYHVARSIDEAIGVLRAAQLIRPGVKISERWS